MKLKSLFVDHHQDHDCDPDHIPTSVRKICLYTDNNSHR